MQERYRYRITGSVFLIALAVIVIPMLFDGAGVTLPDAPPAPPVQTAQPPLPLYEEVVPATDVVAQVSALSSEVDADGFSIEDGTRFGEPVLRTPSEGTSVWAVQAGSFADIENARSLREHLRGDGLEAFISSVKSEDQVMHRVAVGPYLARADAETAQRQIDGQLDVVPVLVEMSP